MAIETLRSMLITDETVMSLCSDTNVNPVKRPQSYAVPAIVMERLSLTPTNSLRGSDGLDGNRVLLDCLTTSYTTARALAAAVRAALEAGGALLEDEKDDYDSQTETFRVSQQWFIWTNS